MTANNIRLRVLPRIPPVDGEDGDAATIAVGVVTTLPPGSPATAVNVGTSSAAIINFGIPQGTEGDDGDPGQDGIMNSVVAGTGIDVDATDPANPIVHVDVTEIFTASVTEINYTTGVTSAIQTQLNNKQPLDADLTTIAGLADPNADRILFWDDSAGAYAYLAPSTGLSISGTNIVSNAPQGQHTIWVPAGAMTPATTSGPSTGTGESTTNKVMRKTLDFDTTSEEFAQFFIQMPKGWNEGTLILQAVWSHPSTTTNFGVAWGFEAVSFADDDALDSAWGTEIAVTDTGGTTDDIYITAESAALTVAGSPAAEEFVAFRVTRVVGNGSDTMAVDARLHGVKVHYTTDANTDD